jgi:hypothetical protein
MQLEIDPLKEAAPERAAPPPATTCQQDATPSGNHPGRHRSHQPPGPSRPGCDDPPGGALGDPGGRDAGDGERRKDRVEFSAGQPFQAVAGVTATPRRPAPELR